MSPKEHEELVDELFDRLAKCPAVEQQAELAAFRGKIPDAVIQEVRNLLAAHARLQEQDQGFLKPPLLNVSSLMAADRPKDPLCGQRFGPYKITCWVGRGAYGDVYQAIRCDHFEQVVAIKLVGETPGLSSDIIWRFENERQILADLDHPNIARLLDGGATADGRPYFVLEYINGDPLTVYCERRGLSVRQRLELFRQVCDAVHHAHCRGVIHRDLKPENVLVTDEGTPKLVDFGIAKIVEPVPGRHRRATTTGRLHAMTPEYASPEQFNGMPVAAASDVYSLGVLLCETLTGRLPFEFDDLLPSQVEDLVLRGEPRPPSELVRLAAAGRQKEGLSDRRCVGVRPDAARRRPPDVDGRGRAYRGNLDKIVLMALRKEPRRRYESAQALADDVGRHLEGRPVKARNDHLAYRLGQRLRRHGRVGALAVVGVLLACVILLLTTKSQDISQQREQETRRAGYNLQLTRVAGLWRDDPDAAIRLLEDQAKCPTDLRDFTWSYLRDRCQLDRITLDAHRGGALCVRYSPDGRLFASGGKDDAVRLWDSASGAAVGTLTGHQDWVWSVAFSPNGKHVASASADGTIRIWDVANRTSLTVLEGHQRAVRCVVYSPDGLHLASTGDDGVVRYWDATTGDELRRHDKHEGPVLTANFTAGPDGELLLVSGGRDQTLCLWSVDGDATVEQVDWDQAGHRNYIVSLRDGPHDGAIAVAGYHRSASTWSVADRRSESELQDEGSEGHEQWISSICCSPDGRWVATASYDHTIRLWSSEGGRAPLVLRGHEASVRDIDVSPDGRWIVSAGGDGRVKVWDVAREPSASLVYDGPPTGITDVAISPDSGTVAAGCNDGVIRLWDLATGRPLPVLAGHTSGFVHASFSPEGSTLASGDADGVVRLWDWQRAQLTMERRGHQDRIRKVAFSIDGTKIFTASRDRTLRAWAATDLEEVLTLKGHREKVVSLALSSGDDVLLSASHDGTVRKWDLNSGKEIGSLRLPTAAARVAIAPDGRSFATSEALLYRASVGNPTVTVWETRSMRPLFTLKGHTDEIFSIAFSPDGRTLATASRDHSLKLWDASNGEHRATIMAHDDWVLSTCFSPDGSTLVSGSGDGVINTYVAALPPSSTLPKRTTYEETRNSRDSFAIGTTWAVLENLHEPAEVQYHPDGRLFATAGGDHFVRLWHATDGSLADSLEAGDNVISTHFSPDGRLLASLDEAGEVLLWDLDEKRVVRSIAGAWDDHRVRFSRDGRMLAVSGERRIEVWSTSTLESLFQFPGYGAIDFSPTAELLAIGTRTGGIFLLNTATWTTLAEPRAQTDEIASLNFSHDGKRLVIGTLDLDRPLMVWDVEQRSPPAVLLGHEDGVGVVAFSRDDKLIASSAGGFDAAVRIWDAETFAQLAELTAHNTSAGVLAFSPSQCQFVASGLSGAVHVYEYSFRPDLGK